MATLKNTSLVGNLSLSGSANLSVSTLSASSHVSASSFIGDGASLINLTASGIQNFSDDVRGLLSANDTGGDGALTYDPDTGVISYTGPSQSEVLAHLSAGTGIAIAGDGTVSVSSIPNSGLSTSGQLTLGSTTLELGVTTATIQGLTTLSASTVSASAFVGDGSGLTGINSANLVGGSANEIQFNDGSGFAGSSDFTFNNSTKVLDLNGNLTVAGTITAREFHSELVSSSIVYESGSTKFGDTSDDTHQFSGSILNSGSITSTGTITAAAFSGDGSSLTSIGTGNITNFNSTVRGLFSGGTGITYASGTGEISLTNGESITFGSTAVSLGDTVTDLSITTVSASTGMSASAMQAGTFTGNGAAITNLTASNIDNFTTDVRGQFSAGTGITITAGAIASSVTQYSDSDAHAAFSAGSGLSYDGSGEFSLTNNSLTIGSTSVSLGGTATTLAGLSAVSASYFSASAGFVGDGSGLTGISATGFIGGSDRQLQFNDSSAFGGSSNLTFTSGNELRVTGSISVSGSLSVGAAGNQALVDTVAATVNTGTSTLYSVSTDYDGLMIDYTVVNGSNMRAGSLMAISDGTDVSLTELRTGDLGDTSGLSFDIDNSSGMAVQATATSNGWSVKLLVRAL